MQHSAWSPGPPLELEALGSCTPLSSAVLPATWLSISITAYGLKDAFANLPSHHDDIHLQQGRQVRGCLDLPRARERPVLRRGVSRHCRQPSRAARCFRQRDWSRSLSRERSAAASWLTRIDPLASATWTLLERDLLWYGAVRALSPADTACSTTRLLARLVIAALTPE